MFYDVALALQLQMQRSRMASKLQGLGACISCITRLYSGCACAKNKMATEETPLAFSVAAKQKLKSLVSEALVGSSNGNPFQIVLLDAGCTVVNSYVSLGMREIA